MTADLNRFERELERWGADLDVWLDAAYRGQEDRRYNGEIDCGYDHWGEIGALVGEIFTSRALRQLSSRGIERVLFFISRNEEVGGIICWLPPLHETPLSGVGELTYGDFLFLCDEALRRPADDSDCQLAASFQKFENPDDRATELLLRFFERPYSYTRRMVLHTFAGFRRRETIELAQRLWSLDDCEHAKLSCLHSLRAVRNEFPESREFFDRYLTEFKQTHDTVGLDYLRTHMEALEL